MFDLIMLQVEYFFRDGCSDCQYFDINPNTGQISSKPGEEFSRDRKAEYFLEVSAKDGDSSTPESERKESSE